MKESYQHPVEGKDDPIYLLTDGTIQWNLLQSNKLKRQ